MDCKYEQDDGCKGMMLARATKEVIVSEDSCCGSALKVMYVNNLLFKDGSAIQCEDEVIFCGDRQMLLEVYEAIRKYFVEKV